MFVAHDQENLIHARQTTAAAKSLAGNVKGLGAKTPNNKAPKTPFKIPLNDENTFRPGKSVLRTNGNGNENLQNTGKKQGGAEKNAFLTPAGPRNRAPLGMKTTNAKATAFQTPGPAKLDPGSGKTQQKSRSPRLRRPKVKILQEVEIDAKVEDEEEPEIEYMPPKEKPLPDFTDDELNFSMFEGRNFTRGLNSTLLNPRDENGTTKFERQQAQQAAEALKKADEILEKACEASFEELMNDLHELDDASTSSNPAPKPLTEAKPPKSAVPRKNIGPATRQLSTVAARSAASALSKTARPTSIAVPTASKISRPVSLLSKKPSNTVAPAASNVRTHALATAAAKSTLGYSRGRAVSTSIRPAVAANGLHKRSATAISGPGISPNATITPARYQAKANKENDAQKYSYQAETELIKKLQNQSLDGGEDDEGLEDCMNDQMPDKLLLGDETFEEFKFDIPEL